MRPSPCRFLALFALFAIGGLLFDAPAAQAQDGPLGRFFSAERKAERKANRQERKRLRGRSLAQTEGSFAFGGAKHVEIDLSTQRLRAYEGRRLVMETRISSGRGRSTPTGRFTAGPYKAENHYSSLYDGAHMPWSVQVTGNIFIHGFRHVPNYPASHGCIRLPIDGTNPARRFYHWVDVGTPIVITR